MSLTPITYLPINSGLGDTAPAAAAKINAAFVETDTALANASSALAAAGAGTTALAATVVQAGQISTLQGQVGLTTAAGALPSLISTVAGIGGVQKVIAVSAQPGVDKTGVTSSLTAWNTIVATAVANVAAGIPTTILIDCKIFLSISNNPANTLFHPANVNMQGTPDGMIITDQLAAPTWFFCNVSNITWTNVHVRYVQPLNGAYMTNQNVSTGWVSVAGAFQTQYLGGNSGYLALTDGVTYVNGANPIWGGPSALTALINMRGNCSNINFNNCTFDVPTGANPAGFIFNCFQYITEWLPNQIVSNPVSVSNITWAAGIATVTTTGLSAYTVNSVYYFYVHPSSTSSPFYGTFACTVLSSTSFTYAIASNPGAFPGSTVWGSDTASPYLAAIPTNITFRGCYFDGIMMCHVALGQVNFFDCVWNRYTDLQDGSNGVITFASAPTNGATSLALASNWTLPTAQYWVTLNTAQMLGMNMTLGSSTVNTFVDPISGASSSVVGTMVFGTAPLNAATSGYLTSAWVLGFGAFPVIFTNSNNDSRTVTVTTGGVAWANPNSLTLSSLTWSGGTVTATTAATIPYSISSTFTTTISGATPSGYNISYVTATVTGTTTFTYPLVSNPGTETVAGTYASVGVYLAGAVVNRNYVTYTAISNNTSQQPPNATYWTVTPYCTFSSALTGNCSSATQNLNLTVNATSGNVGGVPGPGGNGYILGAGPYSAPPHAIYMGTQQGQWPNSVQNIVNCVDNGVRVYNTPSRSFQNSGTCCSIKFEIGFGVNVDGFTSRRPDGGMDIQSKSLLGTLGGSVRNVNVYWNSATQLTDFVNNTGIVFPINAQGAGIPVFGVRHPGDHPYSNYTLSNISCTDANPSPIAPGFSTAQIPPNQNCSYTGIKLYLNDWGGSANPVIAAAGTNIQLEASVYLNSMSSQTQYIGNTYTNGAWLQNSDIYVKYYGWRAVPITLTVALASGVTSLAAGGSAIAAVGSYSGAPSTWPFSSGTYKAFFYDNSYRYVTLTNGASTMTWLNQPTVGGNWTSSGITYPPQTTGITIQGLLYQSFAAYKVRNDMPISSTGQFNNNRIRIDDYTNNYYIDAIDNGMTEVIRDAQTCVPPSGASSFTTNLQVFGSFYLTGLWVGTCTALGTSQGLTGYTVGYSGSNAAICTVTSVARYAQPTAFNPSTLASIANAATGTTRTITITAVGGTFDGTGGIQIAYVAQGSSLGN